MNGIRLSMRWCVEIPLINSMILLTANWLLLHKHTHIYGIDCNRNICVIFVNYLENDARSFETINSTHHSIWFPYSILLCFFSMCTPISVYIRFHLYDILANKCLNCGASATFFSIEQLESDKRTVQKYKIRQQIDEKLWIPVQYHWMWRVFI